MTEQPRLLTRSALSSGTIVRHTISTVTVLAKWDTTGLGYANTPRRTMHLSSGCISKLYIHQEDTCIPALYN